MQSYKTTTTKLTADRIVILTSLERHNKIGSICAGFHCLHLQNRSKMSDTKDTTVTRCQADYENQSEKFLLQKKEFIKQFFGVYTSRLIKVSDSLTAAASAKWGQDVPVKKLADLREEDTDKCILVGTLYKQQKLKPSILREISDENHVAPQPNATFHDVSDRVILEDGLNRIALTGKMDPSKVVTGIVCALLGE